MFKRLLLLLLVLVIAYVAWQVITFPDVAALADEFPKTTAFMDQRREELRDQGKDDTIQYRPIPYSRISSNLRRAVLVSEDNAFYEHEGLDVEGMKEALRRNWEEKKVTRGGSTITQQLAKNLYLSPSRNPLRKIEEYFIARSLEKHLSKKRILELYLNVVEMGERVYGAEAAARHYFGVSAAGLSTSQAALLAGCLPNPRVMNPGAPNQRLRARQRIILSRLKRWGYAAESEVLTAKKPAAAKPETKPEPLPEPEPEAPPETETAAPTTTEEPPAEAGAPPSSETTATTETTGTVPPP